MLQEHSERWQSQLDVVRDELMSDVNDGLRQSIYCAFLKDSELGANMLLSFAREQGLTLDASPEQVIQAVTAMNDDEIDIEMTPDMLASVSGGKGSCTA